MGQRFCGDPSSPAIRATLPLGALCTTTRTARCRGRAAGSPTCTSSWHRPRWEMTQRSTPVLAKWRNWRERGVTRPALTFRLRRGASRRSNTGIFPARSRRSPRSQEKTNVLAAAERSTIYRVHIIEGLSQRQSARRSAASDKCTEAGRFRHSSRGGCDGALTGGSPTTPPGARSARRPDLLDNTGAFMTANDRVG